MKLTRTSSIRIREISSMLRILLARMCGLSGLMRMIVVSLSRVSFSSLETEEDVCRIRLICTESTVIVRSCYSQRQLPLGIAIMEIASRMISFPQSPTTSTSSLSTDVIRRVLKWENCTSTTTARRICAPVRTVFPPFSTISTLQVLVLRAIRARSAICAITENSSSQRDSVF